MDELTTLADQFAAFLVKSADEEYTASEKASALIQNLKQVHHQIKNSGIEFDNTEAFEHIQSALHKIVGAIRDMEAINSL